MSKKTNKKTNKQATMSNFKVNKNNHLALAPKNVVMFNKHV